MRISNRIKNHFSIVLLVLLNFSTVLFGQSEDPIFSIMPKYPKAGDRVTINYNASLTQLKEQDSLSGILYTYADFKWNVKDLNLKESSENNWQAQVVLEPGIALINCVFFAHGTVDRGGANTYTWMISKAPGSYSGWGIMRNPNINKDFPQQLDSVSYIKDPVSLMWINNEVRDNPLSREHIFYPGLRLLQRTKSGDQTKRIKDEVRYILSLDSLNNNQQYDIQRSLDLITNERVFTDSVGQVLVSRYPDGVLARDRAIRSAYGEKEAEKRIKAFNVFRKQFPEQKFIDVYTDTESLYADKLYRSIAYTYIVRDKDYNFVFENLNNTSFTNLIDYAWHLVTIPYNNESMPVDSLKLFADRIFPEVEHHENQVPKAYRGKLSPNEWKKQAISSASSGYLTYAKILHELKEYEKESYYLNKIEDELKYENTEYNEFYTLNLKRQNKIKEAADFIAACLKVNNTSPVMLDVLKTEFLKAGNAASDFDAYVESLKEGTQNKEELKRVLSELVKKPIEGFSLESSYGGTVNLKDQLGKIVVIDMWATWCAPCKKAMPGMKMAVEYYEDDSGVKFYFLDTQEYMKDYKTKTAVFLAEKDYPFEVLYDAVNPETGKPDAVYSKYAEAFKFSGIPQKMIIDQDGYLRWRSTGYSGSPSALADEIKTIVEFLKSEPKS
ncbi:TlpA family protein disulfide reductase [Leeuwenhoekiella sp. H156]|uniref:TlpA family protein disulfide reductase n=1 Tax=Leeuwenhoekiella sp. H156 TaxID=3450128 RepID=UPI003FA4A244